MARLTQPRRPGTPHSLPLWETEGHKPGTSSLSLSGATEPSAPLGVEELSVCWGGFSKQKLRSDVTSGPVQATATRQKGNSSRSWHNFKV